MARQGRALRGSGQALCLATAVVSLIASRAAAQESIPAAGASAEAAPASVSSPAPEAPARRPVAGSEEKVRESATPAEPLPSDDGQDEETVRFIEWTGTRAVEPETLEQAILTTRASWLPWRSSRPFDSDVAEQDLERIELAYRQNGYYEAKASVDYERLWFGGVRVTFRVEEGEPVLLAVRSIALPAVLPDEIDREALLQSLPLVANETFSVVAYRAARTILIERLANAGYPRARVAGGAQVTLENHSAIVHWTVAPGERVQFGNVRFKGLEGVDEGLLRTELEILELEPGTVYSPRRLRRAQRTLYDLGLFHSVSVESRAPEDDDEDEWPIEVQLRERPPRRLEVSVGYGTEDQFRARGEWRHRNFFGGLRQLRLSGKYSFIVTGFDAEFVQPHFLRRDLTLGLDAGLSQSDTPGFDTEGAYVGWRLERPLFEKVTGRMGQRFELREVTNVEANEALAGARDNESFRLSLLEFGLRRIDVDSTVDPHRGTRLSLSLEPSLRAIGSELDYLRAEAELRTYLPLYFDDLVLAGRLTLGVLEPLGGDDFDEVPIFKRFFSGGDTSVRGFGLDLLGPVDANEDPIGGLSLAEASVELRFPIWRFLGGVFFVDAGQVNRTALQLEMDEIFYSTGAGVRVWTPVGPIRLDVATPLNAPRGYPGVRVHFSVGHAF